MNTLILVPPQFGPQITIEIPSDSPIGTSAPVIVPRAPDPPHVRTYTLVRSRLLLIRTTSGALTSPSMLSTGVAVTASTPAAAGGSVVLYAIGLGPSLHR